MVIIKDKTIKAAIYISAYIIFLVTLHFTLGRWVLINNVAKEKQRSDQAHSKLSEAEALVKRYPNPKEKIEEINRKAEELKRRSVSGTELPRVIQQLTKKSSELDIEIISIKPIEKVSFKEKVLPQGVSKAYIEIVLRGYYKTLGEYFKAIGELPIIFTIESVSIEKPREEWKLEGSRRGETQPEGEVQGKIVISSYTVWAI